MTKLPDWDEGIAGENVSRETLAALKLYQEELERWSRKINLVAPKTLEMAAKRHFADSAQLFRFYPQTARHWLDLGAGGGFPGLVIAVMAREKAPQLQVTLVEADARKSAFLLHMVRILALNVTILTQRIEALQPQNADVISARALAPLEKLLTLATRHGHAKTKYLFPKGKQHALELTAAQKNWQMQVISHASLTSEEAAILEIHRPTPVGDLPGKPV